MHKKIVIAISTVFQDAGDATRAIEIAKGLKKYQPNNIDCRIIFFSHGSKFEQKVLDLGFEVYKVEPKLPGIGLYQDIGMTTTKTPLVGVPAQQEQFINLANIATRKAGIRLSKSKWNAKNIQNAVSKIISDPIYKTNMLLLKERLDVMDGEKNSAEAIWQKIC